MTEKTETIKTQLEKGLTTKSLIVGIIISVVIVLWGALPSGVTQSGWRGSINAAPYGAASAYLWDGSEPLVLMSSFLFVTLLMITLVNGMKPTFNRSEVAVIATMIIVTGLISGSVACANLGAIMQTLPLSYQMMYNYVYSPATFNAVKAWIPQTLWPSDYAALVGTTQPGVMKSIDWGMVGPGILFTIGFWGAFLFTFVFFMLLFRRLWVDVEALQFPMENIAGELVLMTQSDGEGTATGGRPKLFKAKWFWLAFLIMFIWEMLRYLPNFSMAWAAGTSGYFWSSADNYIGMVPGSGTISAGGINMYPIFDLTSLAILPWVPLVVYASPWIIGWTYLLSIDVLVGCVIGWLAIWVILPASIGPSVWGAFTPRHNRWMHYNVLINPATGNFTLNTTAIEVGLLAAMAIIPIVKNRKLMASILGSVVKEPAPEMDPNRPLPYRLTMLLFIACFVLTIVFGMAASFNPLVVLFVLVLYLWFMIGQTRMYAESGAFFMMGDCGRPALGHWGVLVGLFSYMLMPWLYTSGMSTTALMTCYFLGYMVLDGLPLLVPAMESMGVGVYRVANKTKTDVKDLFKAVAIATIVFLVVYPIWMTILGHIIIDFPVGLTNIPTVYNGINTSSLAGVAWEISYNPQGVMNWYNAYPMDFFGKVIAGIAVGVVLTLMRDRWSWVRISVAGLALGIFFGEQIWAATIIALIAKFLTLRVGGAKLYEEKGMPIALGFFFGYMAAVFILIFCMVPVWYMTFKFPYNQWLYLKP